MSISWPCLYAGEMNDSSGSTEFEKVTCFKCSSCDFISLEKNAIARHVQLSHDQEPTSDSSAEDASNRTVDDPTERQVEKVDVRSRDLDEIKKCGVPDCTVRMAHEENLKYHEGCHRQSSFECPECQEQAPHWRAMAQHLFKSHSIDMELLRCSLCDYRTSKKELLKFHVKTHGSARPYLCDKCGAAFKNMKQLRNHKDLHGSNSSTSSSERPARHLCDLCGQVLSNGRLLRAHQNAVHFKIRSHLCNYCGYNTTSQSNLRVHLRQHTGEKPFSCPDCEYRTADHNSLRRHRAKHSGEKRYKCPHCSYACIQSSTFKAHLKFKHPDASEQLIHSCHLCPFRTLRHEKLRLHQAAAHSTAAAAAAAAAGEDVRADDELCG